MTITISWHDDYVHYKMWNRTNSIGNFRVMCKHLKWRQTIGCNSYLFDSNDHDPEEVLVLGKLGHRWPGHGNSKLHPQVLIAAIEALIIFNDLAHSLFTLGLPHCFRSIVLFFTSLYFVIAWPWTDVKSLCTFMTRKTFTMLNLAPFGCISSMSIPKFNCSQGMISKKA